MIWPILTILAYFVGLAVGLIVGEILTNQKWCNAATKPLGQITHKGCIYHVLRDGEYWSLVLSKQTGKGRADSDEAHKLMDYYNYPRGKP